MNTLRLSLVTTFALVLSSLSLGGCAADAEADAAAAASENTGTQAEALTPANVFDTSKLLPLVDPSCRAVLVSTGPAVRNDGIAAECGAADPYVGQRRLFGYIEIGETAVYDEAQLGAIRCQQSPILNGGLICNKAPDRVIERSCTSTQTYECPCGVETVAIDGVQAGQCRRLPR